MREAHAGADALLSAIGTMAGYLSHIGDASDTDLRAAARSVLDDPFGDHIDGRYFPPVPAPARVPFRQECERIGDRGATVLVRARHLPVDAVLSRVADEAGDAQWPLLRRWRQAWERMVGDVAAFAAEVGYGSEAFDGHRRDAVAAQAALVACGMPGAIAARDTFRIARRVSECHAGRTAAQHALEDASVVVSLTDARVPFGVDVMFAGRRATHVRVPAARGARVTHRRRDVLRRLEANLDVGIPYWLMPGFLSRCRRRIVETTGYPHLCLALLDMARQGERRAFVKAAVHKQGTWLVDLSDVRDVQGVTVAVARATGPAFPDVAGAAGPPPHAVYNETYDAARHRGRMVVQSTFPFAAEYRFFVVDGRVAAGTASDRASTVPTGPRRGRLEPSVAALAAPPGGAASGHYDRGMTQAVEDRPLVALMAREARRVATALAADPVACAFLDRAYTLDVGVDSLDAATAVAEPIEVNTFLNAGLYAVEYPRVARALAGRPRAGASLPSPVEGAWRAATGFAGWGAAFKAYAKELRAISRAGPA